MIHFVIIKGSWEIKSQHDNHLAFAKLALSKKASHSSTEQKRSSNPSTPAPTPPPLQCHLGFCFKMLHWFYLQFSILLVLVFNCRETRRTTELDLSVDAQMADKASPCWEGSLAAWTGDNTNVWLRIAGSGFSGLPSFLCRSCPLGLPCRGAFMNGGAPFCLILSGLLPCVKVYAEHFQGYF